MKRKGLIQVIFSVIILAVLFFTMDFSDFSKLKLELDAQIVIITLVLVFFSFLLRAIRWQILMDDSVKMSRSSAANSFKFLLVGTALNIVMPAGAGDIAKSYFGYKWTGVKERLLSISIIDKLIAIASLSIMSIYSIVVTRNPWFALAAVVVAMPLFVAFYGEKMPIVSQILIFLGKKTKRIDFKQLMEHFRFRASTLVSSFAISIVGWVATYLVLYICFDVVGAEVSLGLVIAMAPILTIGRLFPLTFNGVGSDEALIVFVFSQNGMFKEEILVGALLYRILMMMLPGLIGTYYLFSTKKMELSKQQNES